MNSLIEKSIRLAGYEKGPNYATIFNVDGNTPARKKRNYYNIIGASNKRVLVLFSYEDVNNVIKDVAVEMDIPVMYSEIDVKNYIIDQLTNILKNVN